jgi:hypothetical protein
MRVHDAYGGGYVDNLTISHVWIHDYYNDCIKWVDVRDSTIEHTTFGPRSGSGSEHGDAMEIFGTNPNIVLRYCNFDWNGQQVFFGAGSTNNGWEIYGTVFHDGTSSSGVGIHPKNQSDTRGSLTLYNNTFHNLSRAHDITSYFSGTAKNNLYCGCGSKGYGGLSSSNNADVSSSSFVSASSDNYRLASGTTSGATLSSTYKYDPDGKTRGSDGNWDVGAFEYGPGGGGVSEPPPEPEPDVVVDAPKGLMVISTAGQIVPISATDSSNDGNVPENTVDANFSTRWSAYGDSQWIQYEFNEEKCLSHIMIAFYAGDQRAANFGIETSTDGNNWQEVFNGTSSGTTAGMERFDAVSGSNAKFIRIIGHGNSQNSWNSIVEVDIYQCGS